MEESNIQIYIYIQRGVGGENLKIGNYYKKLCIIIKFLK